jgi:hypothetical protein
MDMQIFNNMVYNSANKCSIDIHLKLKSLAEELASKGLNRSGTAVEVTNKLVNSKVETYLEELLKEINDFIKDFEVVLNQEESEEFFDCLNTFYKGLIESTYRLRKEYIDANGLENSRFDYAGNLIQNCTHKIETEKQNLQIKIKLVEEKIKRQGIYIGNNTGQANIAIGGTIKANNVSVLDNIVTLKFYLAGHIEPSDTMKKLTLKDLGEPLKITEIKAEILELVDKIKSVNLPESEIKHAVKPTTGSLFEIFEELSLHGGGSVRVNPEERKKVAVQLKHHLKIEVDEKKFFNLGNLTSKKTPDVTIFGIYTKDKYFGEEMEIEKKNLINDVQLKLMLLDSYENLISYLNEFSLIPLILVNEGKVKNSGVQIMIKIPNKYQLLDIVSKELLIASMLFNYANEDLLRYLLTHTESSSIKSFPDQLNIGLGSRNLFNSRPKSTEEEINMERDNIKNLFNYEFFEENDYNVLKYSFPMLTNKIRPKEVMSLPTYIFVKANESISIEYTILSDEHIDNVLQPLTYVVE